MTTVQRMRSGRFAALLASVLVLGLAPLAHANGGDSGPNGQEIYRYRAAVTIVNDSSTDLVFDRDNSEVHSILGEFKTCFTRNTARFGLFSRPRVIKAGRTKKIVLYGIGEAKNAMWASLLFDALGPDGKKHGELSVYAHISGGEKPFGLITAEGDGIDAEFSVTTVSKTFSLICWGVNHAEGTIGVSDPPLGSSVDTHDQDT